MRTPVVPTNCGSTSSSRQSSYISVATRSMSGHPLCNQLKYITPTKFRSSQATCIQCNQIFKCVRPCKAKHHIYGPVLVVWNIHWWNSYEMNEARACIWSPPNIFQGLLTRTRGSAPGHQLQSLRGFRSSLAKLANRCNVLPHAYFTVGKVPLAINAL